jgi:hypothetical protein
VFAELQKHSTHMTAELHLCSSGLQICERIAAMCDMEKDVLRDLEVTE